MNQPHDQSPRDATEPPFVRPGDRSRADEPGDAPEPLAPFFGGLNEIEMAGEDDAPAGTAAADETRDGVADDADGSAGDEIPWLLREDRDPAGPPGPAPTSFEAPSYLGGVPDVDLDSGPEIVSFDDLSPTPAARAAEAAPASPAPTPAPAAPTPPAAPKAQGGRDGGWQSAFPDQTSGLDPARELHVEQAGGFREAGSVLAEEVAVRLERIAHSLRSTSPAELLAGTGDPLEILIIGYVLGAARGKPEHTGDQASSL